MLKKIALLIFGSFLGWLKSLTLTRGLVRGTPEEVKPEEVTEYPDKEGQGPPAAPVILPDTTAPPDAAEQPANNDTTITEPLQPVKTDKRLIIVLDSGHHPGIKNQSPDGSYFEWKGNEEMTARIAWGLTQEGFEVHFTEVPPGASKRSKETRSELISRGKQAFRHVEHGKQVLFLSIHSNASGKAGPDGWGEADGMEMFIRKTGEVERSKEAARALLTGLLLELPDINDRTKGKGYKQADFSVLTGAAPLPAVLIEVDFHDSKKGLANLKDDGFRTAFAAGIIEGVVLLNRIYEKKGF